MQDIYHSLHTAIHTWYDAHGRKSLPWRNIDDSYAIYLSEIMLQQTQVKTVLERFYFPFLERFPTLSDLATAPLEDVLKQWEGLGYYTRARNLHRTAQLTAPALPDDADALLALPGIGKNTAHAILAFAFHRPVPIMEANVKRILCRFFALKKPSDAELWTLAEQLLDKNAPFIYNQAMMDIGATICTPKQPACALCPLADACKGKEHPTRYPAPKAKKQEKIRNKVIVIYQNHADELYVYQRSSRFLHGLYGFYEYDVLPEMLDGHARKIGAIKQIYSHFTLKAEVYLATTAPQHNDGKWVAMAALNELAFSKADHKVMGLLCA